MRFEIRNPFTKNITYLFWKYYFYTFQLHNPCIKIHLFINKIYFPFMNSKLYPEAKRILPSLYQTELLLGLKKRNRKIIKSFQRKCFLFFYFFRAIFIMVYGFHLTYLLFTPVTAFAEKKEKSWFFEPTAFCSCEILPSFFLIQNWRVNLSLRIIRTVWTGLKKWNKIKISYVIIDFSFERHYGCTLPTKCYS